MIGFNVLVRANFFSLFIVYMAIYVWQFIADSLLHHSHIFIYLYTVVIFFILYKRLWIFASY